MGDKRRVFLVGKSRVWEDQQGSRKGADEAGGGCPPERVAGRSLLQVRALISLWALPGIRTQGESERGLPMTGSREGFEVHLPPYAQLSSGFVLHASLLAGASNLNLTINPLTLGLSRRLGHWLQGSEPHFPSTPGCLWRF